MDCPREPWHLAGSLVGSVWLLPADELQPVWPPGCQPFLVAGHLVLLTAWVSYRPPGILSYSELLCGAAVRVSGRLALHVLHIWVDDERSRAGGRALWGMPKEMAHFSQDGLAAEAGGGTIARCDVRTVFTVPGWPSFRGATAQILDGRLKETEALISGPGSLLHATWDIPADGPLGFLGSRKPVFSLGVEPLRIRFGNAHSVVS